MNNKPSYIALLVLITFLFCSHNKDASPNSRITKNASQLTGDCSGKSMKWEWRDPLPYGNGIGAVASGNNIFVGISDGGVVFASKDAINWQRIQTCTYHNFHGVTFGAGNFVAVGDSGTIYISPDGRNWRGVKSGTLSRLETITYGSGKFVAAAENGTICISEDAGTWKISPVRGPNIRNITSGAGAFIAFSYPDQIYKSIDAINWKEITIDKPQENDLSFSGISYVNGLFIATGYIGSESAVILVSADGNVWGRKDAGIPYDEITLCLFAKDRYYAYTLGLNKQKRSIYTSTDLSSWSVLCDSTPGLSKFIFVNGAFVGFGSGGKIFTSNDAKSWECCSSATTKFHFFSHCGIAYGASKFTICDGYGTICTSQDGISWVQKAAQIGEKPKVSYNGETVKSFQYKAGRFVAVGVNGDIFLSPDAIQWKKAETSGSSEFLPGVSAQGICVAVGNLGMIITRKPDSSWAQCKTESNNPLTDVAFGAGRFVAIGEKGTIISSSDGTKWDLENSGTSEDLRDVDYAAGYFLAVGYHGCILSSPGGKQWRREISGTTRFLYGIAYGAGQYLAAGQVVLSSRVANPTESVCSDDAFIGLWSGGDFSAGNTYFLSSDSNSILSENINITPKVSFQKPIIPESGVSKESFIPSGWELMEMAEGDLNGDKSPDIAMVIRFTEGYIINDDNNGQAISHPRILVVLFKETNKKMYRLAAQNSSIIEESTDPSLDEPFGGLSIDNKVLSISFSFFHNMGSWEVYGYKYKFRYQNGAFALIGEDNSSFWRNGANPNEESSCNYLTGKKRTIIEPAIGDDSDAESRTAETTWTDIGKSGKTLESMDDQTSLQQE